MLHSNTQCCYHSSTVRTLVTAWLGKKCTDQLSEQLALLWQPASTPLRPQLVAEQRIEERDILLLETADMCTWYETQLQSTTALMQAMEAIAAAPGPAPANLMPEASGAHPAHTLKLTRLSLPGYAALLRRRSNWLRQRLHDSQDTHQDGAHNGHSASSLRACITCAAACAIGRGWWRTFCWKLCAAMSAQLGGAVANM
jgi:hypothetical protein